jgi:translation initiation factor 2 alpha subunit (eIF-2alpha)
MVTPKVGELVIAQVSKVAQFGAYCRLPEYGNMEAFMPIREVSSGWIKNIREFVHEGQNLVCRVVFFDKERNTIDISLKKVTPKESKEKISGYNLEKRLVALFQQNLRSSGEHQNKNEISQMVISQFGSYTNMFQQASLNTEQFANFRIPKKLKDEIQAAIKASRKQKKHKVVYSATISTFNTRSGAAELRDIFSKVRSGGVEVLYVSAPKYRLIAEGENYAEAEDRIKEAEGLISAKLKNGIFKLQKEKLKKEKEDILKQI